MIVLATKNYFMCHTFYYRLTSHRKCFTFRTVANILVLATLNLRLKYLIKVATTRRPVRVRSDYDERRVRVRCNYIERRVHVRSSCDEYEYGAASNGATTSTGADTKGRVRDSWESLDSSAVGDRVLHGRTINECPLLQPTQGRPPADKGCIPSSTG